ncbi:uncharacterized protein [Atheta coriaria]|uniref:uncharacterized protein isoform X2 n=1 Tax=Dalotia coriaria TaxID=877792 RepID=UPI0031F33ABE
MATSPRGGKAPATGLSSRIHGGVIAPGLTKPGTSHRRQKRMGPAPFASFEDLSDELDSPEDKNAANVVRLPGIREDATPCSPAPSTGAGEIRAEFIYTGISLIGAPSTPTVAGRTPTSPTTGEPAKNTLTPRIDISRASSSSHHDSKESTPDKEVVRIGLEEGAVDLRSSTEEIEFAGAADPSKTQPKTPHRQPPPVAPPSQPPPPPPPRVHSPHHDHQLHEESYHSHNRKDSQSSELGLLCISGRTSRLSSIGSQGSAHSRVSNASHLSVVSGTSRSPSPHKMLLETSFCGTKPKRGQLSIDLFEGKDQDEGTKELERALLQRVHDPTQALIAEGVDITPQSPKSVSRSPIVHEPEVIIRKVPIVLSPPQKAASPVSTADAQAKAIPKSKALSRPLDKVTIKIDKAASVEDATDDVQRPKLPKHIVSESGTEFIYIPLKGPLPDDPPGYKESSSAHATNGVHSKVRETKSASGVSSKEGKEREKRKSKSASPSPAMPRHYQSAGPSHAHRGSADEPKYIRIRLKPEHLYDDFDPNAQKSSSQAADVHKPESLNLQSKFDEITVSPGQSQQASTTKSRYLTHESPKHKSPSPSLSRKSSFASLFKSRETISPDSPTPAGRKPRSKETPNRRSRSKSRDRGGGGGRSSTESIDSKGKSMFSLFSKPRKASSRQSLDRSPGPDLPNLENLAQNIQNTSKSKRTHYESPLQGESVRIPLHSPTYYESKSFFESFKTSSQDSQETVIEVKTNAKRKDEQDEGISASVTSGTIRQSSTSSENIVFSTKLGSNNDIFSTKLPKHQEIIETTTAIVEYVKERVTSDDEDFLSRRIRLTSVEKAKEKVETPQAIEVPNEVKDNVEQVVDVKERRMSSSASGDSRKFRLEKSKRIESNEQLPVVTSTVSIISLSQSTSSSSYIPKSESRSRIELDHKHQDEAEPVASGEISPVSIRTSVSRDSSREKPFLQQQSSEDIPIIAKEKLKLAELKKSEEHYSSESERETDFERREKPRQEEPLQEMEPERKGLVLQQDSFEDELPYIPTTLPQERSMAVPIIPVKQRSSIDVKTCTIERPRSTTPIKPTLEVYRDTDKSTRISKVEKLKISLPKQDEAQPKVKSPRRKISDDGGTFSAPVSSKPDWFDFSKADHASTSVTNQEEQPPPLPPKGMHKEWINFEEIPEKRKAPKRIQTIPSRGNIEIPENLVQAQENVIYTYVNPEDCKCECHERPLRQPPPPPAPPPKYGQKREVREHAEHCRQHREGVNDEDEEDDDLREDEMPLLDDDDDEREREKDRDRLKPDSRSVISDSSVDLSTASHAHAETANGTARTGVGTLQTPFTSDLGVSSGNSNRSSIISQDEQTRTPD